LPKDRCEPDLEQESERVGTGEGPKDSSALEKGDRVPCGFEGPDEAPSNDFVTAEEHTSGGSPMIGVGRVEDQKIAAPAVLLEPLTPGHATNRD
jgi:hypothetical protein